MTPTRAALEPFSKVPLAFTDDIDDGAIVFEYEGGALTLGDFRRVHEALSSAPAADGEAVAGWVLVPREPTEAMLEAAERRNDDQEPNSWGTPVDAPFDEIYRAMLGAAPPPTPADNTALREAAKEFHAVTQRRLNLYAATAVEDFPSSIDLIRARDASVQDYRCAEKDLLSALSASGSPGADVGQLIAWQWEMFGTWYTVSKRDIEDPEQYARKMSDTVRPIFNHSHAVHTRELREIAQAARAEHDAGDGHFSTAQVELLERLAGGAR